jgi:hypothetical protein
MLKVVKPAMKKMVGDYPNVFRKGLHDVRLCMDRAPFHTAALKQGVLKSMGLSDTQLLPHPSYSPDFQAPVEWTHSWVKKAVRQHLQAHTRVSACASIRKVIAGVFTGKVPVNGNQVVTSARVDKAFSKMESNYDTIIASGGSYGAKRST